MEKFKLEFEIRRVIFGLLSILRTPAGDLPQMVQQQLPAIVKYMGGLISRVHGQRLKSLESNEKHVAKGFESSDEEDDENEDEAFEDDGADDPNNPNAVFNNVKAALNSMSSGKPVRGLDEDDSDSDYEENAGEFSLYDSPLEDTDELITTKETFDQIFQADQQAYQFITSTQSEEERNNFIQILGKADQLKAREAACREAFEKHEVAQKLQSVKA